MKQCSTCHSGVTAQSIPSFERSPFGGTTETHKDWIARIAWELDLAGDGTKVEMPPATSGWVLKYEELQDFRNWIAKGAQDENGVRTIDEEWARYVLSHKKGVNP